MSAEVKPVILTPAAAEKVKVLLTSEPPDSCLRVYVQGGGCSGFQYGMVIETVGSEDVVFESEGVKIIVDPMSLKYLEGAVIDYEQVGIQGGFSVKNPNAKTDCGCGKSFSADDGNPPDGEERKDP